MNGTNGTNGNTIWNGTTAPPSSALGANGDFYLLTTTNCLYGPKASGAWPGTCTSLVGPAGPSTSAAFCSAYFSLMPTPPTAQNVATCASVLGLAKIAFITANAYSGSSLSVVAANADCTNEAATAGLPGTYLAWLSDNTASPASTFSHSAIPWILPNQTMTKVAANWTALISGNLANPINTTPTGGTWNEGFGSDVWTGTDTNGTPDYWDFVDGMAAVGNSYYASSQWTNGGALGTSYSFPLYCFQQ